MAHIPLIHRPRGLVPRLAARYSKHKFGALVEPLGAVAHHNGVLVAMGLLETAAERGWRRVDPHLRWLATQAAAGRIGCSWCTDFGYYEGRQQGVDPVKVRDVPRWRDSDVYDERERLVLEFAEVASGTPAEVGEGLAERLRGHFSDSQIVELAAWVALENFRSRFNSSLGMTSEGFSDNCQVPADS